LREMFQRGWLGAFEAVPRTTEKIRAVLEPYLAHVSTAAASPALFRASSHVRAGRAPDPYALCAWTARVLHVALAEPPRRMPTADDLSDAWLASLVRSSRESEVIPRVTAMLRERGVLLIVEPHLSRTRLDGAAMIAPNGWAVVGLTVRYDRLDSFWFKVLQKRSCRPRYGTGARQRSRRLRKP
jgi:HTH-type transcriptional regulator/antitoxin HigA